MDARSTLQVSPLLRRSYDKSAFQCHAAFSLALVFAFVALCTTAAQAQTDPIWFTTLTIGEPPEGYSHFRGYAHADFAFTDENVGSIADDEYSYLGTDNRVLGVYVGTGDVSLALEASLLDLGDTDVFVLEFAGEELPVAAATEYSNRRLIVWDEFNASWVSDNAPSLSPDRYETTLPLGGTVGVCLRTTEQTCPSSTQTATQVLATPEPEIFLQARLKDVPPEHDGSTAFALQIAFSEPIETTQEQMQQAMMVTGGTVTSAQKVDGRSTLWEITVMPNSNDDVHISLPRTTSCSAVGAVCVKKFAPKIMLFGRGK